MASRQLRQTRLASVLLTVVVTWFAVFEQFGRVTHDTKTPLIEEPGAFLAGALTLWNQQSSLGELQNQAYGYLFPQGPFFLLGQLASVPPWLVERAWTVAVLMVGVEGARLLARNMGMAPWPAWIAGVAYGFNPHVVAQVAVRSAEVLPGAVLPWMVLPLVLHFTGRLGAGRAVLFSVVAFACAGAVNGTATGAPLLLVVVILLWAARARLISMRWVAAWFALVLLVSGWWVSSLLRLNAYAPPFFDFVEDAKTTTSTTGAFASLRGLSNWINYTTQGGYPSWPAGYSLALDPWLATSTALLAVVGLLGLVTWRSPWRVPLVISALLGLVLLTAPHQASWGSPLAGTLQQLLDGPLALLRNVHKVDPVLRLPLALGVGVAFAGALARAHGRPAGSGVRARMRAAASVAPAGLVTGLVLVLAQPAVAMNLRTPGWEDIPQYWRDTAAFLADAPQPTRAWLTPGSGFGMQTWGWTMDEPFASVAESEWVSRSQVPLVPPSTIRMISGLESIIDSGTGSPYLAAMLARIDVGYIIVRHDLEPGVSEATSSRVTSLALARSPFIERVRIFGAGPVGPMIEVFRVRPASGGQELRVTSVEDVLTVAGSSSDVLNAIGEGLVADDVPTVVQGDDGWAQPADIIGDAYRDRERNFGRVHDAEGPARVAGEPQRGDRVVVNYPANEGSRPVRAVYEGPRWVNASSSQAWVNVVGEVRPEDAPFAAFDEDRRTGWRSAYYEDPRGQWVEAVLPEPVAFGRLTIVSPASQDDVVPVTQWRVSAGDEERTVKVDPFTGRADVDLGGVESDHLRITAAAVDGDPVRGAVSIQDVENVPFPRGRTLQMPDYDLAEKPSLLFSAAPETRACVPTLLGPDCQSGRGRLSEESAGIDRTVTIPSAGVWKLSGTVVARPTAATAQLLKPFRGPVIMRGSSSYKDDPGVSARFAYDANPATSWIASPHDPEATLRVRFDKVRTVNQILVAPSAAPGVTPTIAVITSGQETRRVSLNRLHTFEPLRTKSLQISFGNPARGSAPIGLGDVLLGPGDLTQPFYGQNETGSVCGYGPTLLVDGVSHQTRVSGLLGDVSGGGQLKFEPCDGPVRMTGGKHRLQMLSTEQFQPTNVALTARTKASRPRERDVQVTENFPSHQRATLGQGGASLLATSRNFNAGWQATLDGKPLAVQRVDGWAQGWRVPAGAGGALEITYGPERSYVMILEAGLLALIAALVLALVLAVRTRLRPARPLPFAASTPRRPGRGNGSSQLSSWRRTGLMVLAVVVAGLSAGLAGILGVVAMVAITRWLPWRPWWPAAAILVSACLWAFVELSQSPGSSLPGVDALMVVGIVVALGELRSARAAP